MVKLGSARLSQVRLGYHTIEMHNNIFFYSVYIHFCSIGDGSKEKKGSWGKLFKRKSPPFAAPIKSSAELPKQVNIGRRGAIIPFSVLGGIHVLVY